MVDCQLQSSESENRTSAVAVLLFPISCEFGFGKVQAFVLLTYK